MQVAKIVLPMGLGYTFQEDDTFPWSWHEMVAQLDDSSKQFVVQGPDHRSRGIVECSLPMTETHNRREHDDATHSAADAEDKVQQWDFILKHNDGSFVVLHPKLNNTKVECWTGTYIPPRVLIFDDGTRGLADLGGRRPFCFLVENSVRLYFRFDATGNEWHTPNKIRPAAP